MSTSTADVEDSVLKFLYDQANTGFAETNSMFLTFALGNAFPIAKTRFALKSLEKRGHVSVRRDSIGDFYEISEAGYDFLENLVAASIHSDKPNVYMPAADRIVSLTHNQPIAREISSILEQIESELKFSNQAFEGDPDTRVVAIAEVSALRVIWDTAQVRILNAQLRASQTLKWVAEKAAVASISELCRHALKLILGWS